jgi:hypothetical protein
MVAYFVVVPLGAATIYGMILIVLTFGQKPLMIVAPEGIYLPVAGDTFLTYSEVEVWSKRVLINSDRRGEYGLSLRVCPRRWLDIDWRAKLCGIRANTATDGDLYLLDRYINLSARDVASVVELNIARFEAKSVY